MRTARFKTEPFSCPSCVKKIESTLTKMAGVSGVKVLFNSSRVDVDFNQQETTAEDLAQSITRLGYPILKTTVS